jgi:hypothetical protein
MKTKALLFAVTLMAAVVLTGCTALERLGQGEQTPTFVPFILPTPSASASVAAPSLSPEVSPTAAGATKVPECSEEGECLSVKPKYCENGFIVNNCGKCGCPEGTQCCRTTTEYGYYCAVSSLCIENWTGMGTGGKLEVVTPTPTPSPSPGPSHCETAFELNRTTPALSQMLSLVGGVYKSVFNKTVSWTQADADTFVYVDSGLGYQTELWFYDGRYHGWQPLDVLKEITNDSRPVKESLKCWRELAVNSENSPRQDPHYYWFKMPCFNWTYVVDARITERVESGAWAWNYSKRFAQNLTNVCLE